MFVTGEPGIGKTALVDAFLAQIATDKRFSRARGQCEEQYGANEAYMPVLQAVEHLCRAPENTVAISLLRQQAPMWLMQLPTLLSPADREALPRELLGSTRERMLREAANAIEALTTKKGLVLLLEDLHWSDHSTVELISFLARQRGTGRLLLLGTYRPEEILSRGHPLHVATHELQSHGQCQELALTWLKETAVREYLEHRFPGATLPRRFVQLVHQRTDGNPLFMVNVADHLVERGVLELQDGQWALTREQDASEIGLPTTLRQGIEAQIARLPASQQAMLEVASVAGIEFSTATVAAGLLEEQETVEQYCEQLARQGRFLRVKGLASWPDGSAATQYEFLHALYQETFYERIAVGRRVLLHQRIGARLEAGYGEETSAIAAELAMHFERGRDYRRAVQYLERAAERAIQRSAHQEAISLLTKGLTLLATLPDTPARAQQELNLQLALGAALMAIKGYTAPEVEQTYSRAKALSRQLGDSQQLFSVLAGLCGFYLLSGALHTAYEFGEQLLALAQQEEHSVLLAEAHRMLGAALFWQGELVRAREHFEHGIAIYDPQKHRSHSFHFVINTDVACRAYAAWTLCLLGYPEQALERSQAAPALARDLKDHHGLAFALSIASQVHKLRREEATASERADEVVALSSEQGFTQFLAIGKLFHGRISVEGGQSEEEGAQMHQEMTVLQARGMKLVRPVFLTLQAEACWRSGQTAKGLKLVTTALAAMDENGERMYEAELYRLKGELLLQSQTSLKPVSDKSKAS